MAATAVITPVPTQYQALQRLNGLRNSSSGFTLVELSIVLVISSLLLVAYLDGSRIELERRRHSMTMERISLVQDAMTHYFQRYGAYPCPTAPAGANKDTIKYENCTALDAAGMKEAQEHGIAFITSKAGRKIIEGAVPYRQLSIPIESTEDGWGYKFTYAVTAGLISHDTFNANDGGIDIVDEDDTSLINPSASALWALVSHGPDGSGATFQRSSSAQSCPPGHRDTVNCSHQGRYVVAPTARANNAEYYDDIVFYRAWVDYMPGASDSYCQIDLPKSSSWKDKVPSMVQDGAMIQVCGDAAEALTPDGSTCQFLICRGGRLLPGVIDMTGTKGK